MNCKPGDIAVYIDAGDPDYGKLVEVLCWGNEDPDGSYDNPGWICMSLGTPFVGHYTDGDDCMSMYWCVDDCFLRPLPGESMQHEVGAKEIA